MKTLRAVVLKPLRAVFKRSGLFMKSLRAVFLKPLRAVYENAQGCSQ